MHSFKSLRVRLFVPVGIVVLASIVLTTLAGQYAMRHQVSVMASMRARAVSEFTVDLIDQLMDAQRDHGLPRVLLKLTSTPDIAAVRVLKPNGEILVSSRVNEVGLRLPAHAVQRTAEGDAVSEVNGDPVLHQVTTIYNGSRCRACHEDPIIGLLDVDVTLARQTRALGTWAAMSTGAGFIQIGSTLATIWIVFVIYALRPIRHLTDLMGRVRTGDLSVAMQPAGTSEFDAVADGFNAMVSQLREGAAAEEETRRLQLIRAEQLSTVGRLATGLAHEIRNPLSGVKAALEVLLQDAPPGDGQAAVLSESLAELSRIDHIIRDLLSYARPRSPSLEATDLNALVNESMVLLQPLAATHDVALKHDLASPLGPVIVDADMVRQVLLNLAMNAIDSVPPGGQVIVSTAREDGYALCRVRDTGAGVPPQHVMHLFEPFFTTKARGTGLGLAISRRLVENCGGRLWLENPGEEGASFAFTIPLASAASG